MNELDLMHELMLALGRHPSVTIWRQNVGKVPVRDRTGKTLRTFDAGPPKGAADITGFVKPYGWRLEIEVKRAGKKRTPEQERHARIVASGGCVYALVELSDSASVARAVGQIEQAIARRRAS